MNILADTSLPGLNEAFPEPFCLTKYHHPEEIGDLLANQDVLLCRSTLKVNQALLKNHRLRYVATASSGVDHLDQAWLKSQQIQIIDAKGSNAASVADYVISCFAYLDKQHLILGKKVGIIGLGAVGMQVLARLKAGDFQISAYDPPKEMREPNAFKSCSLEELYAMDVLCIHAELQKDLPYPSYNLIDKNFLAKLKPGCILINAARGGIVNENALLNSQNSLIYCTDVYLNEPDIDSQIIQKATLCTPHIAGHSLEAKYLAVAMISGVLHDLAGFDRPQFAVPEIKHNLKLDSSESWYDKVLGLYNPLDETLQLKKALDPKTTFLQVRKNHLRHDFSLYVDFKTNNQKHGWY